MSDIAHRLKAVLLSLVPSDGTTIGNVALRRDAEMRLQAEGVTVSEADYWQAHAELVANRSLIKGQGRGGSVRLAEKTAADFSLTMQVAPALDITATKAKPAASLKAAQPTAKRTNDEPIQIISYRHLDKRKNNPEVGMVTPGTDP